MRLPLLISVPAMIVLAVFVLAEAEWLVWLRVCCYVAATIVSQVYAFFAMIRSPFRKLLNDLEPYLRNDDTKQE